MSFVQFESGREKEQARQELREARAQLLEQAKSRAEQIAQREAKKDLNGEKNWMLPSISEKLHKKSKKHKKEKKEKKKSKVKLDAKYKKKKRKKDIESDSDSSDSSNKRRSKKRKHKRKHERSSSSSSSDSEHEWIERNTDGVSRQNSKAQESCHGLGSPKQSDKEPAQHDSWMTECSSFDLKTFTRKRPEPKKANEKSQPVEAYDPAKSKLELNPHWKTTGNGLPAFQKPRDHDDDADEHLQRTHARKVLSQASGQRNWQKKEPQSKPAAATERRKSTSSSSESSDDESDSKADSTKNLLTDQELNQLAAKAFKAELRGDKTLASKLQQQLEEARATRTNHLTAGHGEKSTNRSSKNVGDKNAVLLTVPMPHVNLKERSETTTTKKKRGRVETHTDGARVRYFADDDRYNLKEMFEREKFASAADSDLQFADIVSSQKNVNDDLEDIFTDKVRKHISQADTDKKELHRAISMQTKIENCERCLESEKVDKRLIVAMGSKVYMALPWHVGLQSGHCVLVPMQHAVCATQLDEDTWEELTDFRRSLTLMFASQRRGIVFYEIANKLHRQRHMVIHCIPVPDAQVEMVPFYFKKAIEESEQEWSVNKQLVALRNKSLGSAIPKGLPYFWVNFGMGNGFAHVIEDQERFPVDFAQEILGGLLQLPPKAWRKPQKEQNAIQRSKVFANWWKDYDCTKQ